MPSARGSLRGAPGEHAQGDSSGAGEAVCLRHFFLRQASQTEVDRAVAVSEGAGQHHNE